VQPDRRTALEYLADAVVAVQRAHPVRVAVDGVDAAGKTTLADELSGMVAARGFPVVRASIDGFHRPRRERYRRGRESPEGYYRDSFDVEALRRELLDPLGPGGDRRYRTAVFDPAADEPRPAPVLSADPDAVLLFDGVFLQQPALEGCWDLVVFVECSAEIAIQRGVRRDAGRLGPAPEVEARYRRRYLPGQSMYLAECRPRERAEILVINDDPAAPVLAGPRVDAPGGSSLN